MLVVLKDRESVYRGSTVQLPPPPDPSPQLATAVAVTCRNPVLQTSQISVAADFSLLFFTERQSTLHCQYTLAIFHTHKTNAPCGVSKQLLSTDTVSTFTLWSQLCVLDGKRGTHRLTWPRCRTQNGHTQSFAERNDAFVMPLNRIRKAPCYASWPQAGYTYSFRAVFLRSLRRISGYRHYSGPCQLFLACMTLTVDAAP